MKPLTATQRASLEKQVSDYQIQLNSDAGGTARHWIRSRRLESIVKEFRLGFVAEPAITDHEQFIGRLVIPNRCAAGHVVSMKYRQVDDAPGAKFLYTKGVALRPFNLIALREARDRLWVTEGESDTLTLSALGYPTIGVPGANSWKPHFDRLLAGFGEVILVRDSDEAGSALVSAMEAIEGLSVRTPPAPAKDVSDFYLQAGGNAVKDWLGPR